MTFVQIGLYGCNMTLFFQKINPKVAITIMRLALASYYSDKPGLLRQLWPGPPLDGCVGKLKKIYCQTINDLAAPHRPRLAPRWRTQPQPKT
jgi:hypothetical protein